MIGEDLMSAKTKILVFRAKELIYTSIFVGLAIILIVLFFAMFKGRKENSSVQTNAEVNVIYTPGIYTASLGLSNQNLDMQVTVDRNQITEIQLLNLDQSDITMYPLMEPTLESLKEQILTNQSLDQVTYTDSTKYTSYVLLQAIQSALQKAQSAGASNE